MSHQIVILRHSLCSKSKREGNSQRQTFWHGDDDNGNGRDENPEEILGFALSVLVTVG
jgi:hypothetical protein